MTVLERMKLKIGDSSVSDDLLLTYLEDAKDIILNKRYPFGYPDGTEIEAKYETVQVAVAMELYSKLGAEGETAHSENGISRTYENGFVSSSLLKSVVPKVGSVGVKDA